MNFYIKKYVIWNTRLCCNKINELKIRIKFQNLQVWSNFPGVKHEDSMRSIKLFTEKVMPKIFKY